MALIWQIPSFYGDIHLSGDDKVCLLKAEKVTPDEKEALVKLEAHALKKRWTKFSFEPTSAENAPYRTVAGGVTLDAPIQAVEKMLVKLLKPKRSLLRAVRFSEGKIEPLTDALTPEVVERAKKEEARATTVAAPTRGCPAPDFVAAELKARGVLEAFLDPGQRSDFREFNGFVTMGQETGHRYAVTSRHARGRLARFRRSLFDLDESLPYCVHDWEVPAAEEMLALHLFLSIPGGEGYLRGIPDMPVMPVTGMNNVTFSCLTSDVEGVDGDEVS